MFEYLCFEEKAFIACMNRTIKLDFSDGQLFYKYSDLVNGEKEGTYNGDAEEVVKTIEALHIETWEKEYKPECEILDGHSWSLKYKQTGKKTGNISGENMYPVEYDKLTAILYKIVGIEER